MAITTTPTLTSTWSLVVAADMDFLLTIPIPGTEIEVATTDADAPTVTFAHRLTYDSRKRGKDSINRALLGPGVVYARTVGRASLDVALNAWTP